MVIGLFLYFHSAKKKKKFAYSPIHSPIKSAEKKRDSERVSFITVTVKEVWFLKQH